jgi:alkylation response protein AidB-like acyl-CoA dehydrogenase
MSETSVSAEDFAHVLDQVRRFVRRDVVPRENEIMSQDRIPDDLRAAAAEMGLFGTGYMRDVPVERIYRDLRLLRLYEGTSEIQRLIVSGGLIKQQVARS